MALTGLDIFCDECIRRSNVRGFQQTIFEAMRARHGTVEAIMMLMENDEEQSGLQRLNELGLINWSVEAAVVKFHEEFTPRVLEISEIRLRRAQSQNTMT